MPHGALIEARLMADEIEAQIEEAANMGEPPSFALARHQADWLLAFLRKPIGETVSCNHVRQTDFQVVRLYMCHACIEQIKASHIEAQKQTP